MVILISGNSEDDRDLTELGLDPLVRLSRDLKLAADTLGDKEARFLVDYYYTLQDARIVAKNVIRASEDDDIEPHEILSWLAAHAWRLESTVKSALGIYAQSKVPGQWAQSILAIGPVLSAGVIAHFDITKAPTAGHFWSFAGQNPEQVWKKGEKRPWNASLRTLCWKIGESFMKFRNHPNDVYGHYYDERKLYEQQKNEAGEYAERAAKKLETTKIEKPEFRRIYESGKLPDGHIHSSAKRWVTKLFLAHLHHVMYECHYGTPPPKPYIIDRGNHVHMIAPPNWPMS